MENIHKNKQIFGSYFLAFSIKIFFTKLCVIIGPKNSLELALNLFAELIKKLKIRGNSFIFIEISNGGNVTFKLIYFKGINFRGY